MKKRKSARVFCGLGFCFHILYGCGYHSGCKTVIGRQTVFTTVGRTAESAVCICSGKTVHHETPGDGEREKDCLYRHGGLHAFLRQEG